MIPAADTVNLTGTMASASLTRRKLDRVINPAFLKENKQPPWGEMDQKQWVKTLVSLAIPWVNPNCTLFSCCPSVMF